MSIAVLICVWTATGRAQDPPTESPEPPEQFGPVDSAELFGDRSLLAPGTNVSLDKVVVRSKSGNLLRVSQGRHQLYVVPVDPSLVEIIAVGAVITVRGTLRQSPSASQARTMFAAGPRAAARLARDHVYVDAWDVSLLPHG